MYRPAPHRRRFPLPSQLPTLPPIDPLEPRQLLSATGAAISFAAATSMTVGTAPIAIVTADFNNDGNLDLAVADRATDKVSILFGTGTGTFNAGPILSLSAPPSAMATGDFDGNGSIDLAVATSPGAGSAAVTIFLNTAGTFSLGQTTTLYTGGAYNDPVALAVGDFNKDSHLDIAATDYSQDAVLVLDGNGNGTFGTPTAYAGVAQPTSIVAADFDNDGNLDLAVAGTQLGSNGSPITQAIDIYQGSATGAFTGVNTLDLAATSADVITTADLNNDGEMDLIVGSADGTGETLLNQGTFTFTAAAVGAIPGPASAVAAADLNFDGDADVIFTDGANSILVGGTGDTLTGQAAVSVLEGNGDGTFATTTAQVFPTAGPPVAIAIGDFNNDGKPDIAVADEATGQVSILLNNTAGAVSRATTTTLSADVQTAPAGEAITFTATVATSGTGFSTGVPTGTVNFYDAGSLIGSATLAAAATANTATATFTTTSLPVGNNQSITARYAATGLFAASASKSLAESVTATSTEGPDLIGTIVSTTLSAHAAAGTQTITVRVTNDGNSTARGILTNALSGGIVESLSPTSGEVPALMVVMTFPLRGNLARASIDLAPGQSELLVGRFVLPNAIGVYGLSLQLNSTNAISESDTDNNTVSLPDAAIDEFGTVAGHRDVGIVIPAPNNTAMLCRLTGPGTGTFSYDVNGVPSLTLTGTTLASTLTVLADVAGRTTHGAIGVNNITIAGFLSTLSAPYLDLNQGLTIGGGARRIVIGNTNAAAISIGAGPATSFVATDLTNTTLTSASGLTAVSVKAWVNTPDTTGITAPWIGTLSSPTLSTALNLSGVGAPAGIALRAASIPQGLAGIWSIDGNVGQLSVGAAGVSAQFSGSIAGTLRALTDAGSFNGDLAAANIGSVVIRGSLATADLLAGANFGPDGIPGGGDDTSSVGSIRSLVVYGSVTDSLVAAGLESPTDSATSLDGDTLLSGCAIDALTVRGTLDSISKFLATSLPAKVRFGTTLIVPTSDPTNFALE